MVEIVVPFRGNAPKTRLHSSADTARTLALAMLGDVLSACVAAGHVTLVTDDEEAREVAEELGADVHHDPGGGQGAAVASALATRDVAPTLVVNADVPCATPRDLRALVAATPAGGLALVEAHDGTTNALSLPAPQLFAPLYGAASAARFRDHARSLGIDGVSAAIPNLVDDVDTAVDLRRVQLRAGPRTQAALAYALREAS
jgi:2-phospho-L-lactate/phosphoenolpyruvate guanylyltransferase